MGLTLVSITISYVWRDANRVGARKHNIRLIIKNTGHDYMGRSVAPGSLSLWTHHLKSITYHKKHFKLYNSKTTIRGDAVTAEKGGQLATKRETAEHHLGGSLGHRYDYREQQCSANRTCCFYQNNQAKSVSAAIQAMFKTKPIRIISFCLI